MAEPARRRTIKAEQVDLALSRKFVTEGARLVFWRDPNGEFADYIEDGLAGISPMCRCSMWPGWAVSRPNCASSLGAREKCQGSACEKHRQSHPHAAEEHRRAERSGSAAVAQRCWIYKTRSRANSLSWLDLTPV